MPARRYEVRVAGRLSPRVRAAFVGMNVEAVPAETIIASTMDDDDELHCLLTLIQSLGLHVVSVEQVVPGPRPPPRGRCPNDRTSDSGSPPG